MNNVQAHLDHIRGVEDVRTTEEKLKKIQDKLEFYTQVIQLTYVLVKFNEDGKAVGNEEVDLEELGLDPKEVQEEEEPEVTQESDLDITLNCDSDLFRVLYKFIGENIEYQVIAQVDGDNLLIHEACLQIEKPAFLDELITKMRKLGDGSLKEIGEKSYLMK